MSTKDEEEILSLERYLELKAEGFEFEGQSYLFWEYMRLLNETKPKYFLLENVMMGEKWEKILSKAIGVKQPYQQNRVYDLNGISPALCAHKSDLLITDSNVIGCDFRTDEGLRFRDNGKSGTLAARARNDESCGQLASVDSEIRRLTPIECERLQTVKDNYTNHVSDSQRYKMLGNGWTVDVIVHILKYIK
jgi:site-specific DNA-cytosine methylase